MEREGFIAALLPICDFVCEYDRRREKLRVRRSEIAPELAGSRWYTVDALSDALLRKPGPLTPEEFDVVKTHTTIGENLLRSMKDYTGEPLVEIAADICRWHHERVDGRGYPDGLQGDEIPISAQVVGLADAYDALVSRRAYKDAFSPERAMDMIRRGECGAFDPLLVECLQDIQDALRHEVYTAGGAE